LKAQNHHLVYLRAISGVYIGKSSPGPGLIGMNKKEAEEEKLTLEIHNSNTSATPRTPRTNIRSFLNLLKGKYICYRIKLPEFMFPLSLL